MNKEKIIVNTEYQNLKLKMMVRRIATRPSRVQP